MDDRLRPDGPGAAPWRVRHVPAAKPIAGLVGAALALCLGLPAHAAAPGSPGLRETGDRRVVAAAPGADAITVAFENRLNSALQKMLDAVVGPGRAVVTTAAELDLGETETVTRTFTHDPSAGALTESLIRSSSTDQTGGTRYESTRAVRANALNSVRETRRNAPGDVRRLSVAVLLDAAAVEAVDLARLRELIGAAAGIDATRGDAVVVTAMPFSASPAAGGTVAEPAAAAPANRRPVLVAAGLALLLLILLTAAGRRRRKRESRLWAEGLRPHRPGAALPARGPAAITVGVSSAGAARPRHGGAEGQRMIGGSPGEDPARAAAVLHGWVEENGR
ncbi:flagellar M-ring protein FliF C-terminal domain-containing protein [Actinoplanes sp. NEAU-A12]|uniref:Flagellar M-ring protein FliF C-terminal domain-containing protein n=1 Tax=Actinoplanes sandaracinus TaxID=3045177 RepID=A0ABT6WGB8_9ACTN|nr:flagellar M-ring protein FliF C-terminal domain-containing protein [Actinoplanes sandaracinus]MDI6098771.1 flagellar M-ring protein FliF C-terminal domain-containing protein [Actinoplanes sandaracinus]